MIPYTSGGAYRRPGSFFETAFSYAAVYAPRIIPFIVSETEAYIMIFSQFIGGGRFVSALKPTSNIAPSTSLAMTGTPPYMVPPFAGTPGTSGFQIANSGPNDEITEVQYIQQVDVMHLVHRNRKPQRIIRTAVDTFKIKDFDADAVSTYALGVGSGVPLREAYPYRPMNANAGLQLYVNTATVGIGRTLFSVNAAGVATALFDSNQVGSIFKVNIAGTMGSALITAFVSSSQVTVSVLTAFGAAGVGNRTPNWWESSWSDFRGWPRSVSLFQARICYGGNKSEPDTVWFGQTNNFNVLSNSFYMRLDTATNSVTYGTLIDTKSPLIDPNVAGGAVGSQPFQGVLNSNQMNKIQHMSSEKSLFIGTEGDEWIVDFDVASGGFGADNASLVPTSHFGSAYRKSVRVESELVMCLESKTELKALAFNDIEKAYNAEAVQALYDEKPQVDLSNSVRDIRSFSWDQSRHTLWCFDTRGNFFGMTRDKKQGINLWHSHQMGGYDSSKVSTFPTIALEPDPTYRTCAGSIVSMAVLPNPLLGTQDIWLVVKRKLGADFFYHFERIIGRGFEQDTAFGVPGTGVSNYLSDACSYFVFNPAIDPWSEGGLSQLEGTVPTGTIFNAHGIFELTSGAVAAGIALFTGAIPTVLSTISVGFPFSSIVEPVRVEAGSQIGTSQGALKRIHQAVIRFYRTMSAKVGSNADNLDTLVFRKSTTPMGYSPELFTGDQILKLDADYDRDGLIYILQDKPLPFAVVSVIAEGATFDG